MAAIREVPALRRGFASLLAVSLLLLERAAAMRLTSIALTDHDTLDGIPRAAAAASCQEIPVAGKSPHKTSWAILSLSVASTKARRTSTP